MRPKTGAQGTPANNPNNAPNPGFNRSQSPPPSSPKSIPPQMVTRRIARRQADANEPAGSHPPPAKIARTSRTDSGGKTGQRVAKGTGDNITQSATDSSPLEEVDNATFLRALVDKAKEHALAADKHRRAEEMETVYQQALYQQSLGNAHLTSLLETNLRRTANPQETDEFYKYIRDARKQRRSDSTRSTESWTAQATPVTDAQRERAAKQRPSTRKDSTMTCTDMLPPTVPQARRETATPQLDPIDIPTLLAIFCVSTLWPRYCLLMPGRGTMPEFESLTTTQVNDRGERSPAHPAPESWLSEAQAQLTRLLEHARPDKKVLIPRVMEKPGYKGQDVHVLLAEEVKWAIHQGPFKGRQERYEIGLLIECVGIERKGTFWKG